MKRIYVVKQETYDGSAAFACESEDDAKILSLAIWGESRADTMVYDVPLIERDPLEGLINQVHKPNPRLEDGTE